MVLLYSVRFSRRMVTRPGSGRSGFTANTTPSIHAASFSPSSRLGCFSSSGGIAPDLRKLDRDCVGLKNEKKKQACYTDNDNYFLKSVRHGKVRNGAVYMPPFETILNQEAMWAIKAYLETRREAN